MRPAEAKANNKAAWISVPRAEHHGCGVLVPHPPSPLQLGSRFTSVAMPSLYRSLLLLVTLLLIIPLPPCPKLRNTGEHGAATSPTRCFWNKPPGYRLAPGGDGSASARACQFLSSSIILGHCIFRKCSLLFEITFVTPMFLCQTQEEEWKGVCLSFMF